MPEGAEMCLQMRRSENHPLANVPQDTTLASVVTKDELESLKPPVRTNAYAPR